MGVSKVHLTVLCACRSQDEIFTTNWGLRGTSNAEGRVGGHGRDRCGGLDRTVTSGKIAIKHTGCSSS